MGSELLRVLCALLAFAAPLVFAWAFLAWDERQRKARERMQLRQQRRNWRAPRGG
jgi:hypothetical protein